MKRTLATVALAALALMGLIRAVQAQEAPDARILAFDKGPSKIDVSKYPTEIKDTYKLFTVKCGKCHTVARAINCEFALPDEWDRYVKRMMRRAGDFISADDAKKLTEFLAYDSKTRKKALYEKKLANPPSH
jgi:hypothetical protein